MRLLRIDSRSLLAALALALLDGCGAPGPGTPPPVAPPRPPPSEPAERPDVMVAQPVRLAADTVLKTGSGLSGGIVTASKGWLVRPDPSVLVLEGPERELTLAIVERREPEAGEAIAAAWKKLQPKFARPIRQIFPLPAREGWDAITQIVYDVPDREGRAAVALARRKGPIWYVALIDGSKAALERRAGELATCIQSLRAPGVEEESFKGKSARPLDPARLRELEAFADGARKKIGVPGLALAVVQGRRVVYQKGFGLRELGKPAPITPRTLFLIGSITKSMTSLLMAVLVDRRKLKWETPVTELMPGFALGDAEATRQLTMQHTVCACTGLPRQDMEFIFEYRGVTPEQRLEELRAMKPTTRFGEAFQYSNPMVSAGGFAAAHLVHPKKSLGDAYDRAMADLVFRPVGMRSSTFDFKRALRGDHATPHGQTYQLTWKPVAISNEGWLQAVRPCGGAWSNLRDMTRYVLVHLGKGKTPEGKRVVSEENLTRRYQPQVRMARDLQYGLALVVDRSYGIETIWHTGGTAGFTTEVFWIPEHDLGAVILTNGSGNFLPSMIHRKLLELVFEGRNEAQGNLDARWKRLQDAMATELRKIDLQPKAEWLKGLVAEYSNPSLGKLQIRIGGDKGIADVGEWQSSIAQKREVDGTSKVVMVDPPWNDFELTPGQKDGRRTLLLETNQQKYLFVEAGPASTPTPPRRRAR